MSINPWNDNQAVTYNEMWLGSNSCRQNINFKISGDKNTTWFDYILKRYIDPAIKFEHTAKTRESYRCLLLGSNEGWMERSLCENGFIGQIIASDIADNALNRAKQKIDLLGYKNVTYIHADLNQDSFDGKFDFIIAEGVLHHIENIEKCLKMIESILLPDGFFFCVEFEGPIRFQLSDLQVRWINAALNILPKSLRPFQFDSKGNFPANAEENSRVYYVHPSEESIISFDPSEALSGPKLKYLFPRMFKITEKKGFGGTLLSYMTGHFDFKRANEDEFANSWLLILMQIEDTLIYNGILEDDFVFYVMQKK